jgi:hypothetical protein
MAKINQPLTQKVPFLFALPASGSAVNSIYAGFFYRLLDLSCILLYLLLAVKFIS